MEVDNELPAPPNPRAPAAGFDEDVDLAHAAMPHLHHQRPCTVGNDEAGNAIAVRQPPALGLVPGRLPVPLKDLLALSAPTLLHIPQVLQSEWDRLLSASIDAYVANPTVPTLTGLLALPKLVLHPPRVKGRHSKGKTISALRDQMAKFWAGTFRTW